MSSSSGKRNGEKGRKQKSCSCGDEGMALWGHCGKRKEMIGYCC